MQNRRTIADADLAPKIQKVVNMPKTSFWTTSLHNVVFEKLEKI